MRELAASVGASPCILVVDDDRRVVDLLNIALAAHGYRVLTAADGEEAIKVAYSRRPDLVVLDVRLPRKSGLEVCELLRQDPEDPHMPIIMVSAASETEARLQGFARGADDYLAKPFSPKELVARIRRLLVRAGEAREARKRGREAELELSRTREDVKRAHLELRTEQRLRSLTVGVARDLQGTLDRDELAGRFLLEVQTQIRVSVAALLLRERPDGPFTPVAIRGDGLERVAALQVSADSELVRVLGALGRPARRAELERFPELRSELLGLVAAGFSLIAPLGAGDRIEGLLVADERLDGEDPSRLDVDVLALLCAAVAPGLDGARRCRALVDQLIASLTARALAAAPRPERVFRSEAAAIAGSAARALVLPARLSALIEPAALLAPWVRTASGGEALAEALAADPTGRLRDLAALIERGEASFGGEPPAGGEDEGEIVGEREAGAILGVAGRYAAARSQGRDSERALDEAIRAPGCVLDLSIRQALSGAAREMLALERYDA